MPLGWEHRGAYLQIQKKNLMGRVHVFRLTHNGMLPVKWGVLVNKLCNQVRKVLPVNLFHIPKPALSLKRRWHSWMFRTLGENVPVNNDFEMLSMGFASMSVGSSEAWILVWWFQWAHIWMGASILSLLEGRGGAGACESRIRSQGKTFAQNLFCSSLWILLFIHCSRSRAVPFVVHGLMRAFLKPKLVSR